jgi:hypothetical protein
LAAGRVRRPLDIAFILRPQRQLRRIERDPRQLDRFTDRNGRFDSTAIPTATAPHPSTIATDTSPDRADNQERPNPAVSPVHSANEKALAMSNNDKRITDRIARRFRDALAAAKNGTATPAQRSALARAGHEAESLPDTLYIEAVKQAFLDAGLDA